MCAVALGAPNADAAWAEWLDCLRREAIDFNAEEMSSSSWARDSRPEPDFEVVATGLLWVPPETRPDPEPRLITHHLGAIADVCGASERVCRRLADEALKIELSRAVGDPPQEVASVRPRKPPSFGMPVAPDISRTMTLKEAAEKLRVSDDTLQRMRKRGDIAMFKVGSQWRVRASEVIRLREQPRFENR